MCATSRKLSKFAATTAACCSLIRPAFRGGSSPPLEIQTLDEAGEAVVHRPAIAWEGPFVRELKHFHACITEDAQPRTPLEEARCDIALIIDIIKAYLAAN